MNTEATAAPTSSATIEERVEDALYGEPEEKATPAVPAGLEGTGDDLEADDTVVDAQEQTADTLAKYLGLAEDQVFEDENGQVLVNAKVDGEIIPVPFNELVKSYQLQKHVNNKSMQLSEKMRAVDVEYQTMAQKADEKFYVLDQMAEALEAKFVKEYQEIDWQRLRRENPAEYVAAQKDFEDAYNGLQRAKQVTLQQREEVEMLRKQQQETAYGQFLAQQASMVLQEFPEWQNPGVRQAETSKMRAGLVEHYGFQDHELNAVSDHRQLKVIRDALAYRMGATVAQQKVAKSVPTFQKPGAIKNDMSKARAAKNVKATLKRSGNVSDLASALESRM